MIFNDAINYIRADQDRKITRAGRAGFIQWYTTSEANGFKNQTGAVVANFPVDDVLAADWEAVEA